LIQKGLDPSFVAKSAAAGGAPAARKSRSSRTELLCDFPYVSKTPAAVTGGVSQTGEGAGKQGLEVFSNAATMAIYFA